jgi:hypothetical protein
MKVRVWMHSKAGMWEHYAGCVNVVVDHEDEAFEARPAPATTERGCDAAHHRSHRQLCGADSRPVVLLARVCESLGRRSLTYSQG